MLTTYRYDDLKSLVLRLKHIIDRHNAIWFDTVIVEYDLSSRLQNVIEVVVPVVPTNYHDSLHPTFNGVNASLKSIELMGSIPFVDTLHCKRSAIETDSIEYEDLGVNKAYD